MIAVLKRLWQTLRVIRALRNSKRPGRAGKISDDYKHAQARKALMLAFADARGVMMKVGQLFASADISVSPTNDADDELVSLVRSIQPQPLASMLPAIEAALGCRWDEVFDSIDESSAAASLGQVHHAVLKNGDDVAIKVQYPDIRQAVDAEMTLLGWMPKAGPVKTWQFDLDGYRHALRRNMEHELNYTREAAMQQLFEAQLDVAGVVVPHIYEEYCSPTLLVQGWEQGDFIDRVVSWPASIREKMAETLLKILLKSLFRLRRLHGDPHPGNSFYRLGDTDAGEPAVTVVMMDFGCTIELSELQSMALLKLILALREKSSGSPLQLFAAMGFDPEKLEKIEASLPRLALYLFEPFLVDEKYNLSQWQPGCRITELLQEQRWWFRSAGPPDLIFIMRAFQGLFQQLEMLKVSINWSRVFAETLPESLLQRARQYTFPVVRRSGEPVVETLAELLRVKVVKEGVVKAEVTLPAEAVLHLDKFIPAELEQKLKQSSKVDLEQILQRVRESGIAAQQVIDYKEGLDSYQVWLE